MRLLCTSASSCHLSSQKVMEISAADAPEVALWTNADGLHKTIIGGGLKMALI